MTILSFRTKEDKEHLLEKAKKMEEYAAMIVDCIEDSIDSEEYDFSERNYRHDEPEHEEKMFGRYGYRRRMR